ncbi:DUF58 domain-containing protein [Paracoccus sp. M683]|uniref:DUF58 domain-containing protein n=1 Tax=Paracoccus sp. M683 TaxID=2594268 RepID=UPI0011810E73|nr:DUF58 domain-containing protein [Paracoccus sp. M683]TRW97311.1 DUF58 domain-containing protein [Paracoccus sp. M683]
MVVSIAGALNQPGLRLTAGELLALRPLAPAAGRHRPATRRPGALPARFPGAGMDLRELRAWVEGDDPRRIDPSATARTGIPHIRSFHEDRDDTTLLIADFRGPMLWGTGDTLRSVRAARHLAAIGWQATMRGGNVAALVLTEAGLASLSAGQGDRQMAAVAQMLAGEHDLALTRHRSEGGGLAALAGRAARLVPPGSRIHLATAPQGIAPDDLSALARLARRRRLIVSLILDPAEVAPVPRALAVTDGAAFLMGRLQALDLGAELARLTAIGAQVEQVPS